MVTALPLMLLLFLLLRSVLLVLLRLPPLLLVAAGFALPGAFVSQSLAAAEAAVELVYRRTMDHFDPRRAKVVAARPKVAPRRKSSEARRAQAGAADDAQAFLWQACGHLLLLLCVLSLCSNVFIHSCNCVHALSALLACACVRVCVCVLCVFACVVV